MGTSLIRKRHPVGPYMGICVRPYGGPRGVRFLMSEAPLYACTHTTKKMCMLVSIRNVQWYLAQKKLPHPSALQ